MQPRSIAFSIAAVAVVTACGASTPSATPEPAPTPAAHHGHHPDFPACAALAKTCHAHDKDSDQAHTCHVLGHTAKSNEECEAKRAECLAICAGDAGT